MTGPSWLEAVLGPGSLCSSSARTGCSTNRDFSTWAPKVCFLRIELFAGHAGFSKAVKEVAGDAAEVMEPLDGYYFNWDVFVDVDFARAKEAVERADHTHLALMCKSFTRARRTDSHGTVDVTRSDHCPLGWGHPLAEQGNKLAE